MEWTLAAAPREETGTGKAIKLRAKGQVPAVLYGEGKPAQPVSISAHEFGLLIFRGGVHKLIDLKLDGSKLPQKVLVKEYQRHPVKGSLQHVDFLRVAMDHPVNVKVKVHMVGDDKRMRDGAILELLLHEVEVHCLPADIPERINVDVSQLPLGTGIHVKDLSLPASAKFVTPLEETVVLASAPTVAAEPTAAETTEAAAEPEVVGAKKEATE